MCLEIVLTPDQPFISSFQNVCHALLWDQYIMGFLAFIFSYSWYEMGRVVQVIIMLTFVWELPDCLMTSIPTILTGVLNWYTWSLQANTGIVPQTGPRLFLSLSFHFILYYHSYGWPSVYTWLLITTALILQLVSVQQLTIFKETKCIIKLLVIYITKWSTYPWKLIGIYISQMCTSYTVVCILSCLPMPYW